MTKTVAPNTIVSDTRPAISTTLASASFVSISTMRDSMKPCRSFAASYSAFSLKSPCDLASAIASMTWGRSTLRSRSNSALSASYPFLVIGVGIIPLRFAVILLERTDRQFLLENGFNPHHGSTCAPHGRIISQAFVQGFATDGERIGM